jgi:tetratricopeptide (TPR) repeat protein
MKKGDVEAAISTLNQAISLNPRDAAAYRTRGLAYVYKNDNDNALSDLTRAIQFARTASGQLSTVDIFSIYRSRALLYDVKGLHSREIADLTEMIDMYWKDPGLAQALDRMWTPARAKSLIASIHRLRAAAHARISANDKAFTDLALAIELDPQHAAEAYNDRAKLEDTLGNRTQAVTDFRKAVALDPNMKEPRESLARMGLGR